MRASLPATTLIVIGFCLLGVAGLGDMSPLGNYHNEEPRPWEAFDKNLVQRAGSYEQIIGMVRSETANASSPAAVMEVLHTTVSARFSHGLAEHNGFSNWVLWTLGVFHPAFRAVRSEELLVERGHALFCSQSSYVLLQAALALGIPARHVGLNGHVVMEAFYDDAWHLYDPDLEVVVRDEAGTVLGVQALIERPDLLAAAYSGPKAAAVPLLLSHEDNTFMSYPPGAWFVWKDEVLYHFESIAEWLKYIVPVFLIVIGMWRLSTARR